MNERYDSSDKPQDSFGQAAEYAQLLINRENTMPEGSPATPEIQGEQEPIERKLSLLLNSNEFKQALDQFPDDQREKALGWGIEYMGLMRDGDAAGLSRYMSDIHSLLEQDEVSVNFNQGKAELLVGLMAEKLGVEDIHSEQGREQVFTYFSKNKFEEGFYYHSFNGVFEASIREHGLQPEVRTWDEQDLQEIREIGKRVGIGMLLGWSHLNSKGMISVSDNTDNIYHYATASPEWFAQFVSEGAHMNGSQYDRKAFARRDYEAAARNMEYLCDELSSRSEEDIAARKAYPNLTSDERGKLMNFFNTHWDRMVKETSGPKLALIERQAVGADLGYNSFDEYVTVTRELEPGANPTLVDAIDILSEGIEYDLQIRHVIDPRYLHIVDLPEYDAVHSGAHRKAA